MSMRSIRRIALTAAVVFSAFGATMYTSCNPDECKDVVCANGGTCNSDNGACTCATGYEGTLCETAWATKFIANYTVVEQCSETGGVGPYTAAITANSSNVVNINLNNFGDFNANITVSGTVTNTTTLSIPSQTVSGYTISGSGSYNNGVITITYTVSTTLNDETCTATWTKQ